MKKFLLFIFSLIFAFGCTATVNFGLVKADETDVEGVIEYGSLTVHFIDVGQADACIVELPDGRTMLIDAGENNKSTEAKLDEYIAANIPDSDGDASKYYFDFAILTHSDADHIGSMDYVLENYPARIVYRPNEECKNATYCSGDPANDGDEANECFWGDSHGSKDTVTYHWALYRAYESAEKVIVTNPYDDTQNVITSSSDKAHEEYQINFYAPLSSDYGESHNDYSPIIVIDYQGRSIVVSGDAEAQCEAEFVAAARGGEGRYARFADFSADVIKLGHHGSRTSSSEDYLNVMTKSELRSEIFVIISCGEGNKYNHPHSETLERISVMGFSDDYILRTDLLGDIVVSISEVDGKYEVTYADQTGGEGNGNQVGGSNDTPQGDVIDIIVDELNRIFGGKPFTFTRRGVIIAIVVIVVIVLIIALLCKQKSTKKKKSKQKNKENNKRR